MNFTSADSQADWVAEQIQKNIQEEELDPNDIVVIFPEPRTLRSDSRLLQTKLSERGVISYTAGVSGPSDQFVFSDGITICHVYRAKGNEAPMVYVCDAHYCHSGPELIKKRNTLFTAITRSRGWVRVCGWGPQMVQLQDEVTQVRNHSYVLDFKIPTPDELDKMRRVHRDMTDDEKARLHTATSSAEQLIDQLKKGEIVREHLPEELRAALQALLSESEDE